MSSKTPLQVAKLRGGGSIIDVEGDLMTATNSLAHCVSQCLGMGKGIAVYFKKNFGGVDNLKAQNVGVGGVAVLPRPAENRFIYYLITKPRYFHKPTEDTLRASLRQMKSHMVANGVPSVSIPELGCGLDQLVWSRVYKMLAEEFIDTGIDITVFHFRGPGQTAPPTLPSPQDVASTVGGGGGAASGGTAQQKPPQLSSSNAPSLSSLSEQQQQQPPAQKPRQQQSKATAVSYAQMANKNKAKQSNQNDDE